MDLEILRSLVTVAAFGSFLGIAWWAYAPSRKERLEAIAKSILEDNT